MFDGLTISKAASTAAWLPRPAAPPSCSRVCARPRRARRPPSYTVSRPATPCGRSPATATPAATRGRRSTTSSIANHLGDAPSPSASRWCCRDDRTRDLTGRAGASGQPSARRRRPASRRPVAASRGRGRAARRGFRLDVFLAGAEVVMAERRPRLRVVAGGPEAVGQSSSRPAHARDRRVGGGGWPRADPPAPLSTPRALGSRLRPRLPNTISEWIWTSLPGHRGRGAHRAAAPLPPTWSGAAASASWSTAARARSGRCCARPRGWPTSTWR